MELLNKKDREILYLLSQDARMSYKHIAKKIHSNKDTVAYHVSQMIDKGIITKFVPVFSLSRLGIFGGKIYLSLRGLSSSQEKELYLWLVKNPAIAWVAKVVGTWDLFIGMYSVSLSDFATKKNEVLSQMSQFISSYDITFLEDAIVFDRDYLFNTSIAYRKEFVLGGKLAILSLSEQEKKIIRHIRNDARFEYGSLAQELGVDVRTIKSKISSLETRGVIQGYTTFVNIKKLGIQLHKLCFHLQDHRKNSINKFVEYLKMNPSTIHLIKSIGPWEIEVEIETGDLNQIHNYISELKNTFPDLIRRIDLASITDELKIEFFPELL
ncbi:Lrp/AsnC family transcriptional regulator [Candidatus Woesearchaeota archaeon]|nr:Lrp/AsnC family transcriptional regulator [Candidatus Woesearchaeota archaeon]